MSPPWGSVGIKTNNFRKFSHFDYKSALFIFMNILRYELSLFVQSDKSSEQMQID